MDIREVLKRQGEESRKTLPDAPWINVLGQMQLLEMPCPTCEQYGGSGPSHRGSNRCKSGSIASGGTMPHCTCSLCF